MTTRSTLALMATLVALTLSPFVSGCAAPTEGPPANTAADDTGGVPPTPAPVVVGDDGADAYVPPDVPTEFDGIDGDTLTTIENITYMLDGVEYALVDGVYDEPTEYMSVQVFPPAAVGDLTGDGLDDAGVLLAEQTGGSGTFKYLTVVMDADGEALPTDPVWLGDRVKITAMNIAEGVLSVDVVTHGPDDPMCCPTDVQTWMFTVTDGQLELVSEQGPTSITG